MSDDVHDLTRHDLNLLVTLKLLLETRSTIRTAEALGRTQSAVSHALKRLRGMFDDKLFIRRGMELTPTPRALALAGPVDRALGDIALLVSEPDGFAPETSTRVFQIAAPELCSQLFAEIAVHAHREAPGVSFDFTPADARAFEALLDDELDLVIAPTRRSAPPGLKMRPFLELDWVVHRRAGHPIGATFSLEEWLLYPQVQVALPAGERSTLDEALLDVGRRRTIAVTAPDYLSALTFAASSDLLFTAPCRPLTKQARRLGLAQSPAPLELPGIPLSLFVNATREQDPALVWLTDRVDRRVDFTEAAAA